MVTLTIPITATPPLNNTLTLLTIPTVLLRIIVPQPDTGLPPDRLQPIRRSNKHKPMLGKQMLSAGPRINEVNSPSSEQPLRPSCPNYTCLNYNMATAIMRLW
jgi:hypothetical protein